MLPEYNSYLAWFLILTFQELFGVKNLLEVKSALRFYLRPQSEKRMQTPDQLQNSTHFTSVEAQ